jgi:hypothetical protein
MTYVLTTDITFWNVETAGAALVQYIELRRDGGPAAIRDDAGRRVEPAHLVAEAIDQAIHPSRRQALGTVLADYVEFLRQRELDWAHHRWATLSSPDREADLLLMRARAKPTAHLRRADAEELQRMDAVLFGDGDWREAGGAWAYYFGEPPKLLLDELARRHPDGRLDQFVVGAHERVTFRSAGSPAGGIGNERIRSLVSDLVDGMSAEDLVEIIAQAVRVNPTVRSRAEALATEWRRGERTTEEPNVSEDVFQRARELEREFFDSMSRANRPDVVRDEDGGMSWGDTFSDAESAEEESAAAELTLYCFVRAHRSELESDPHWQGYIEDLARVGLLEQPATTDAAEERRVQRAEWARGPGGAAPPPEAPGAGRPAAGRRP